MLKKKAALKLGAESAALVRKRKSSVEMPQSLAKQSQVKIMSFSQPKTNKLLNQSYIIPSYLPFFEPLI